MPNWFAPRMTAAVFIVLFALIAKPVHAAGLPVQFALDEGSGALAINSGGMDSNGVLVGGPIYTSDTADGSAFSLQFDRLDDRIELGELDVAATQLTLAAWMKADSFPGSKQDPHIISKSSGNSLSNTIFVLGTVEAGSGVRLRVRLRVGGQTITLRADPGHDLVIGQWHHTAATYDGVVLRLYLDGVEVASRSVTGTIAQAPGISVAVGSQPNGGRYFHGLIDDVRILDEVLGTAQIQAIVDGVPSGEPPEANSDSYTTTEDSTLVVDIANGVLSNDTDPESDALTASLVSDVINGTIFLETDGSFAYAPNSNFAGSDSFTYRAVDSTGVFNDAVVSLNVAAINDSPVAVDDVYTTRFATLLVANVLDNDFDVDNASLTVALIEDAQSGELLFNSDGSFSYSPEEDFSGQDSFTYIALDADNAVSAQATVAITVLEEGGASFVPGSILSLRFEEGSGTVAVDSSMLGNDGTILGNPVFTTSTGNSSAYALEFDGAGDSVDLGALDVTSSELTLAAWFQATTFPGRASDPRIISKASGSSANRHIFMLSTVAAGSGVRLRARLRVGGQTRTLRADAGSELSTGTWYHAAFTYDGSMMRIYLDGELVGSQSLSGSIDQDPLMGVAVGSQPGGGRHFNGSIDDVTILDVALDGAQLQTLITGQAANATPVAEGDNYFAVEDQVLSVDQLEGVLVNDTDAENDVLSVSLETDAEQGSVILDDEGSFVYTPDADFFGIDTFSYRAFDGTGFSNLTTVEISVAEVNDQPVALDDEFSTTFETSLTGNVLTNDLDADGDILTALIGSLPVNGTIDFQSDGGFVYTPQGDFSGTDSFSYLTSDAVLLSLEAIVSINVEDSVPEGPMISSAANVDVIENQLDVISIESSGAGLVFELTGGVDQSLFAINNVTGVLVFSEAPDFEVPLDFDSNNEYEVQVTVTDSEGLTDNQAVRVYVLDAEEDLFITSASSIDINENQTDVIDVESNGTGLNFGLTGGDDISFFDIDSETGVVTFKSAPDFEVVADSDGNNVYDIEVTAEDSADPSINVTQLIAVTVLDVQEGGDLLVHLQFDDDLTPLIAADITANGNDGVISGAAYVSQSGDASGTSLEFDGSNDSVSLGNLDAAGTGLTVAVWINADSFPGSARDPRIVSKASGAAADDHVFMLGTIRSGTETVLRARVRVGGNTVTVLANTGSLQTGVWYHAAMVYDESILTLYLDGVPIGSASVMGPLDQDSDVEVSVGSQPTGGKFWDGLIDNLRIANRPFSAGEIAALAAGDSTAISLSLPDSYITGFETPLEIDELSGVLANDIAEGAGVFVATLESDVAHGTLTLNIDGSFVYIPDVGFSGADSFEYRANNSEPATVSLLVDVPEVPVGNGVYDSDQEVTYKEYWISHEWFTAGGDCGAFPPPDGGKWFIEPLGGILGSCPMFFDIDEDFSNAIRAEVYMDIWRGRTDSAVRFNLNGGPTRVPDVGAEFSRTPYVEEFPLSELVAGENVLNLWRSGGQYHIHDIAIRIYHSTSWPLLEGGAAVEVPQARLVSIEDDNGLVSDLTAGGELFIENDTLTLTAFASGDARFIEFHAYYDGYDEDNDGLTLDWHSRTRNNWHPGGRNPKVTGGTIDHLGTRAVSSAGSYSIDWDVSLIPAQSRVRFKVRVVDGDGNVRDAAGGATSEFQLKRTSTSVDTFSIENFMDGILQAGGSQPPELYRSISLPEDLSIYTDATIVASYWSNPLLSINGNPAFYAFDDCAGSPCTHLNSHWQLSVRSIPLSYLQGGDNELHYQHNAGFGEFIEKPGPMVVLRGPKQPNRLPVANEDSYDVIAGETFNVAAAIGVLSNDVDADGDLLSVVLDADVSNGLLSLNDNGSFTYTPNAGYVGPDLFTYLVTDGTDSSLSPVTVNLSVVDEAVDNDMLVHLEFEDFQSPLGAVDSSTNGNFGTIFGAEYIDDTGDGSTYAMEFTGDDTVALSNLNVAGSGLTLASWVNADSFPGQPRDPRIVSKASGTSANEHLFMLSTIRLGSETVLRARIRVGGSTTTLIADAGTSLSINTWHHVAVTYDGADIILFLDGVEVGREALTGGVDQDSSVPVAVGSQPDGSNAFDGKIDDVRILQRALSESEIRAIIGVRPPTSLVAQSLGSTEMQISWAAVTEAFEYQVYRDGVLIASVSDPEYIDQSVAAGVGYFYEVFAVTYEGNISAAADVYAVNFVSTQGPWWNNAWNYRLGVFVDVGDTARDNAIANLSIDFDELIVDAGGVDPHDASRVRCVEVTTTGELVDEETRCQSGDEELVLMLSGTTAASTPRYFHVYFDTALGGEDDPRSPLVTLTESVIDEGFESLEIETNTGRLNYHTGGAGFSSLVDNDGIDWISYNSASGSNGAFRGIPNLVPPADGGFFHPGPATATTTVLDSGPIRVRLESVTDDAAWSVRWDVYPNHLAFKVLEKPDINYWFLYEGTPGGVLDAADFTVRSTGTSSALSGLDTWGGDIPGEEWVMVNASEMPRSLFVAKQNDDIAFDSYRPASLTDGVMTILGFGRNGVDAELSNTDDTIFVGFLETQNFTTARSSILSIVRALDFGVGGTAERP